jgi:integrase
VRRERAAAQAGRAARAPEPPKEPTFAETVARYLTEYAPSALSPSTLDGYRSALRLRFSAPLGELTVTAAFDLARSREIDVVMVEGGLCHTTRRNAFLALRSVAKFAFEAKILVEPPAFLPLPKQGKRVPSAPPPSEVAAVIDAASCPEHRLVILLAAHGGLRKGEIRALRCGDCELDRDRLIVRLSRCRGHTGPTKSGHEREVPLTPQLRAAVLAAGVDKRPREECAALSKLGRPWGNGGPYRVLQRTLARLNLPPVRLHALRAFFVTTLLNGHVPAHVVRELVGHGNLATTQGYAAIVAGDRGAAVGVLDGVYKDARRALAVPPTEESPAGAGRGRARWRSRRAGTRIRELRRRLVRQRGTGNRLGTVPIAAE